MAEHDPAELLTIDEIAERLGVAVNTVYGWRHRGQLPDPDEILPPRKALLRWRWATIAGANLPPRRTRAVGRPQA